MKKNAVKKLSLNRETLHELANLRSEDARGADDANLTQNTCFQTCYCRSAYTCYWSECACFTAGC
jgi:hypothetical protein